MNQLEAVADGILRRTALEWLASTERGRAMLAMHGRKVMVKRVVGLVKRGLLAVQVPAEFLERGAKP